jgi:hypothetical protein
MGDTSAAAPRSVTQFVRALRWTAGVFAAVCLVAVIVLIVRAPDCIGIGISVLGGQDCSNRHAYYLILAASTGIVTLLTMIVFAIAYGIELLGRIADGRGGRVADDPGD